MAKLRDLGPDAQAEQEGVWVEHDSGIEFKIRPLGNPEYTRLRHRLQKPQLKPKQLRKGLDPADVEEQNKELVLRTILVDWKNVEDDEGNEIPYSPEEARKVLWNPSYGDRVVEFILAEADDLQNFKESAKEEASKN